MLFNRLLEYRPRDRLERMTDTDRTDLMGEVLHKGPSENTWRALYELFALWPDNEAKFRSLEVAERELAPWDDRLRFADTASMVLFNGARLSSLARVVRSIRIYRRGDGGRSELLAVVTSEEAGRLTRLSIVRSEIGRQAWQTMVESPYLTSLQHLHVTNTVMGSDVFQQLLQSSRLPRLQCLKLIEVGMDEEYLHAAPQTRPGCELQQIDFSRNLLVHDGVLMLSQSPWLQSVERLALRHNHIREPAMRALLSSPFIRRMKQIDLSNNEVTDSDRTALRRFADAKRIELTV